PHRAHGLRAGAVRVDAADLAEESGGALRDAAAVPAGSSNIRELHRCLDLAGDAVQPLLPQQPVGMLGHDGGHDVGLGARRLRYRAFPLCRARRAAAHLSRYPDVSQRSADRPAADAMARTRVDRYLPGADLLELLVHGTIYGLDDGRLFQLNSARSGR